MEDGNSVIPHSALRIPHRDALLPRPEATVVGREVPSVQTALEGVFART